MAERGTVVLVAEDGRVLGSAPKLAAHQPPGSLHLAFSVFLYRGDGSLLLQRRAEDKYHFAGIWANACCSHLGPGEELVASAERRVTEELGLHSRLQPAGSFVYRAPDPLSGLVEHELDQVLVGAVEASPRPDPAEVAETRWERPAVLLELLAGREATGNEPGPFAPWLLPALRLAEAARAR